MILDEMKSHQEVHDSAETLANTMHQRAQELGLPIIDVPVIHLESVDDIIGMPHPDDTKTI